MLLNGGRGKLLPRLDWYGKPGSAYGAAAIGGLNGDGRPDLVTTDSGFDGISIFTDVMKR